MILSQQERGGGLTDIQNTPQVLFFSFLFFFFFLGGSQ